jgi:outer membrane protein assembly factor BamB
MTLAPSNEPTPRKPLRLWPGVVIVLLQWVARFGVPVLAPEAMTFGVLGGVVGGLGVVVWWVFLSRAPWIERLGAVVLMIVAVVATRPFLHESIATGAQGMLFAVLATPVLSLAFVAWALASRRFSDGARRASMVAIILLACGAWSLVRTGGITASFDNDLMWRWAETPEERLLARAADEPAAPPPAQAPAEAPEERPVAKAGEKPAALPPAPVAARPEFRGPGRDGIVRGVHVKTNWSASPPVEIWRRPIGPGWSSFAVRDGLLYTQEQRGDDEVVACYDVTTGKPVWRHRDAARFWESNAGAGPRATPTLSNGRVYTLGATGILNVLDAADGAVVWSRNAASDTGVKVPSWGFAGSPLVVDDVVVVATAGTLAAYDSATGDPLWSGPAGGGGYSSPHLLTIDGVAQVLLLHGAGVISVAPADGALLWKYEWPGDGIVQPALTEGGNVLIGTGSGMGAPGGIRRIVVGQAAGEWTVEERWSSAGLKPYFNDFVVHEGHAYGFDGSILACIDLEDGKRRWKGGRYGNGQLVLLPDQDLLLVLSEQGELALVAATPDQFTELARLPALEGKTWNHPVLVGDVLLVRNSEEMAAFRLP